jgi:hypothetical protein
LDSGNTFVSTASGRAGTARGSKFGFMASLAFGLVFAYLTIVTGRWLFGRKEL